MDGEGTDCLPVILRPIGMVVVVGIDADGFLGLCSLHDGKEQGQ